MNLQEIRNRSVQSAAQKDHYLTRYEPSKFTHIFSIFLVYLEYFFHIRSICHLSRGQILTIKLYGVVGVLLWDYYILLSHLEDIYLIIWSKNGIKNDFFSPKYHIFQSKCWNFDLPKFAFRGFLSRVLSTKNTIFWN